MSSDIAALKMFMPETFCFMCSARIKKGEPRAVIMLLRFAVGPGYADEEPPEFKKEDEETFGFSADSLVTGSIAPDHSERELDQRMLDEDRLQNESIDGFERLYGLHKNMSTAVSICDLCTGKYPTFQIMNPWHISSEETGVGNGRSVWTGRGHRLTDLDIQCGDLEGDHDDGVDDDPEANSNRSGALNEAEDRFVSERSEPTAHITEDDLRAWMARSLLTPEFRHGEKARTLRVWSLWSEGLIQSKIEKETGTDQSTVSRLVRAGKAKLYSSRLQTK